MKYQPMLSLAELQRHDPGAKTFRFCCPLDECLGKPINATHRTLVVDHLKGYYFCHRCNGKGRLEEWHRPYRKPTGLSAIAGSFELSKRK